MLSSSVLASGVALDLGVTLKGLTAAGRMALNEVDGLAAPLNRTDIIVLNFTKPPFLFATSLPSIQVFTTSKIDRDDL